MTPSDSTGLKIGGGCKQGAIIFHESRVVVNFCAKIHCHGNKGRQGRNSNDTIRERRPENREVGENG